jgi:hypothetical protein
MKIKYKTKAVNFKKRKSRLAIRILRFFRENRNEDFENFGLLLNKYALLGMSKKTIRKLLQKIVGDAFVIRETTLDEAIKAEIIQGRTKFYYRAKVKDNPYHGNRGIIRKVPECINPIRVVTFTCECGEFFSKKTLIARGFINLAGRTCPKCKTTKLSASFRMNGKKIQKKLVEGIEKFVSTK